MNKTKKDMGIIIHVPHVSLDVPRCFYEGLLIKKNVFHKYNLEMADIGLLELLKDYNYKVVYPKYSRLYCDVERFADDSKEVMSKYVKQGCDENTVEKFIINSYKVIMTRGMN